jgi:hypothetical protein
MPVSASVLAFAVLYLAVFGDQGKKLVGKDDTAAASSGLDLNFD